MFQTPHVFSGDSGCGRLADSVRCHQVGHEQDWSDLAGQQSLKRAGPRSNLTCGQVTGIDLLGHISQDATLSLSHLKVVDGSPSGERDGPSDPNKPV